MMTSSTAQPFPARLTAGANHIRSGRILDFTFRPSADETVPALARRIGSTLRDHAAHPAHLLVYGDNRAAAPLTEALVRALGGETGPVTWVEGAGCAGEPVAGVQLHAFTGEIEYLKSGNRTTGAVFTADGARQCLLGGLSPANGNLSRKDQTAHTLESLGAVLATAGFELADLVRTWFFLDNILEWYDDFNRVRTGIYSGVRFHTGSLPASTGVGARNPGGTALALAAWAWQPLALAAQAREVASPLQCPAPAYGSSFARAMELSTGNSRRLFISGTASIAPGGATLWTGDLAKQVKLTMDVVQAILQSRSLDWSDLARATAYFRHASDAPGFARWLADSPLAALPVICCQCDVCRDDLLFEIEAEAVR